MFGFFKKQQTISNIFRVGYNDGLIGEAFFNNLEDALANAEMATSLTPNNTVRAYNGRLIRVFD